MPIPSKKQEKSTKTKQENSKNKKDTKNINTNEEIYEFNEENWQDTAKVEVDEKNHPKIKSFNIYKKIAISFLIATFLLAAFITYLYLVKVTIVITPSKEEFSDNLIVDILDQETFTTTNSTNSILGVVREFDLNTNNLYKSTGKKVISNDIIGKVEIINNYSKNQPLVASTRLLTSEGKLFRIKETVNVPAGSKVEVEVYTDSISEDMAISPTTFTIPGLWKGIQDKIFAKSSQNFELVENSKIYIAAKDIKNAKDASIEMLEEKANTEIKTMFDNFDNVILQLDQDTINHNTEAQIGEEIKEFNLESTGKVRVIAFNNTDALQLTKKELENSIIDGKQIVQFYNDKLEFELNSLDIENNTAIVNLFFTGQMSYNARGNILEKHKLVSLTRSQLEKYLENLPDIKDYQIIFSPKLIQRVPNVTDRINIIIK